jgi:DNA polymerase-3 subunit delta'
MWPVIGHKWAAEFLKPTLQTGRVPHALLLAGPSQVGKRTMALAYAQALNCLGDAPPCGTCLACRKIAHGNHPDVRLFDETEASIKIEQIRALQRELALSPVEGRWRVAILTDFERATLEAKNALLKTLEEPAPKVVLILTTTDLDLLLPTIVSRCQVLSLRPLSYGQVRNALIERWGGEEAQAELLARLSGGRLGWAVGALTEPRTLAARAKRLDELQALLRQGTVERFRYAEQLSTDQAATRDALTLWLTWWRDVWLAASGCREGLSNADRLAEIRQAASRYGQRGAQGAMLALRDALRQLERNVNYRLALELLMLSLPAGVKT